MHTVHTYNMYAWHCALWFPEWGGGGIGMYIHVCRVYTYNTGLSSVADQPGLPTLYIYHPLEMLPKLAIYITSIQSHPPGSPAKGNLNKRAGNAYLYTLPTCTEM